MTTRQILNDVARCLRTTAAPLITLAALTLRGTPRSDDPAVTTLELLTAVAWRAAIVATSLWFLVALAWIASRPWRDRRAFERLQSLREAATPPDRALVHVQTTVWSSTAGQHVVLINVATGATYRVWLPETTVAVGAFVVLERTDSGVSIVDWMKADQVEAGHRHERHHAGQRPTGVRLRASVADPEDRDPARQLIEETEQFLKERGGR